MSEPQTKLVDDLMDKNLNDEGENTLIEEEELPLTTPTPVEANQPSVTRTTGGNADNSTVGTANNNRSSRATTALQETDNQPLQLTGDLRTLKDAFPNLELDIIETILNSQGGNVNAAFDVLLGMSDPSYKPDPQETENLERLRQDEEYAKQLARESTAQYKQQVNAQRQAQLQQQQRQEEQEQQQPLFNLQEDLPMLKEKVMEFGTAAKNKITNFYNQFMAGSSDQPHPEQQQQQQPFRGSSLEARMGNLSLSNDERQPRQQPLAQNAQRESVNLYEWDGREEDIQPQAKTSTPAEQLLSDEDFARQLARKDAVAHASNNSQTAPQSTTDKSANAAAVTSKTTESTIGSAKAEGDSLNKGKPYTISDISDGNADDDLDDLFDKKESNIDSTSEDGDHKLTNRKE
ncbi:hypothetical protein BDF20DRAFT_913106 [Mycotypha africana]|uniref:uncharacterized protein n=1 Tax=Mycotypha africana TaxID=64632 RepID=UPI002300FF0A|nr:uncharacterized protein BDF20DRAFT_913106 [Mycotypha africana]KAI8979545.1 hypothetical protein BDF20DRAFT_913106 [Mycotypha africana]